MNFIKQLDFTANLNQMSDDLDYLLKIKPWPVEDFVKKSSGNQLGIKHRPGATDFWMDGDGSLINRQTGEVLGRELDFTEYNPNLPAYTRLMIEELSQRENVKFGRIRYMRLMPKSGLSIHADSEQRYHFVLKTNPHALFGHYTGDQPVVANCYHIPSDGHFYKVDTTVPHFVYNGGWEPRIHLVIAEAK